MPKRPYVKREKGKMFYCYPRQPIGYVTNAGGKVHPIFAPGTHLIKVNASTGQRIQPRHISTGTPTPRTRLSPVERKIHAREAKRAGQVAGETGLNEKVKTKLHNRYGDRAPDVLAQAREAYHFHNPHVDTNPEIYELSEGGYLDEAVDSLGLHHSPRFDGKDRIKLITESHTPTGGTFGFTRNGQRIGKVQYGIFDQFGPDTAKIDGVEVNSELRGQHLGGEIWKLAESKLRKQGIKHLRLLDTAHTPSKTEGGSSFWTRQGFKVNEFGVGKKDIDGKPRRRKHGIRYDRWGNLLQENPPRSEPDPQLTG